MMRSLDQVRAARAYAVVEGASSDLLDVAKKLPAILHRNGLLATWAFCLAKEGVYTQCLEQAFLPHFREESLGLSVEPGGAKQVFQGWVGNGASGLSGARLRRLTEEATQLAGWLKRAAEAAA